MASVGINAQTSNLVISLDRTTRDWSDLAMGAPSAEDDANQGRNPQVVISYVPAFGKPHADAGAVGFHLPRLNDGKFATTSDDPANSIWFDTKEQSRILVDLGQATDIARINVYSWHSGALSPQRYTLWASDAESAPSADSSDLSKGWKELARVDTFPLGEGGKHGSSINSPSGVVGRYRYLLFDLTPNKPEWSRSGFLSEIDVYAVGRKLDAVTVIPRQAATQTLAFGNIRRSKPLKEETEFLIAGPKLYEYGSMDGTFPRVGRLDGDQGGIWSHPIKLLNTFEFEVLEDGQKPWRWVGPTRFEHQFATATFEFEHPGLKATRIDFVPEEESALLSEIVLRNESDHARSLSLQFRGVVNLRPSYESQLPDGPDAVEYRDGLIQAFDTKHPDTWGVVFGADRLPVAHRLEGNTGFLTYSLELPARGETRLRFAILGDPQHGVDAASKRFGVVLGDAAELLRQKKALYRDKIVGGVQFTCSDTSMSDAFVCAKANVMMSNMDLRPGYPARFLAAGFPIYTWLFGCDSLHSTAGVAAAGFEDAARDTLLCLLHFADQKKQGAHEVASNGRLLGWDHIQETPQLVLACWEHFQWSRDLPFLKQAYPICQQIIAHALATADQDHDEYLEGPALMEQAGMGSERLDSVCYLYAAYQSLANMADTLGMASGNNDRRRASALKKRFNRDWWNTHETMWACSLRRDHTQTLDHFWAVVFPQRTGIADLSNALPALDRIQKEWVNDQWGFVAQWKPTIEKEGVGVVHNTVLAQTAFSYGRADLAWKLMQLSAKAPLEERMLGAFDETLPGGGDLIQLWSFGPFLQTVIEGLAGIRPQPNPDQIDLYPQLPGTLDWFKLEDCRVGRHRLTVDQRRTHTGIITTVTHTKGDASLKGIVWLAENAGPEVQINGRVSKPTRRSLAVSGIERPSVNYELAPGHTLTITVSLH